MNGEMAASDPGSAGPVRPSVCAIVDASEGRVVVWHVQTGSTELHSRLTGAWELGRDEGATLATLTAVGWIWATSAGEPFLVDIRHPAGTRRLEPAGTLAAVQAERDGMQASFDAEQARRTPSKRLVPLQLPPLPGNPPQEQPGDVPFALALASWLERLCQTWDDLESARLARPVLARDDHTARPVPLVAAL